MRYITLLFFSVFMVSCAGNAHLRRVVHEKPSFIVELNQSRMLTSPAFQTPYDHPLSISTEALQKVLQSIKVVPGSGFLNTLFSGKQKPRSVFNSEDMALVTKQLSNALAKVLPGEKVDFYYSIPKNDTKVLVSSGVLVLKDQHLHFRLKSYQIPMQKGNRMRSAEQGIPRSEKAKYSFVLLEDELKKHRRFKSNFGFKGSDDHWLVIDYQAIAALRSAPAKPVPMLPEKTLEERLRSLKRFREEELITEQEYGEKKAALLKEF